MKFQGHTTNMQLSDAPATTNIIFGQTMSLFASMTFLSPVFFPSFSRVYNNNCSRISQTWCQHQTISLEHTILFPTLTKYQPTNIIDGVG